MSKSHHGTGIVPFYRAFAIKRRRGRPASSSAHRRTAKWHLFTAGCFAIAFCLLLAPLRAQNNTSFQYFYDDVGRLVKAVDSASNVVAYSYDVSGNIVSITRSTLPSPGSLAVFNLIPQQGPVGAMVTIQGQGFNTTAASDSVSFNGTHATVSSATATQLVVTVPAGAKTGPVSVAVGGVTAQGPTFTVTVALTSIAVTPMNPALPLGTSQQFTATGTFSDGTTQNLTSSVTWASSSTNVATILSAISGRTAGLATAVGFGTTTITATSGSVTGTTTLVVTPAGVVSIAVSPADTSVPAGISVQYIATATLTDGTQQIITDSAKWASSNAAVATISNIVGTQGLAQALAPGTVMITATSNSISGSTTLIVTAATRMSPRFAYVPNSDSTISIYTVQAATGQLRPRGYVAFPPSAVFENAAVDPTGKFAYFLSAANGIEAFAIDPATGNLTPIPGSPFPASSAPHQLTIAPSRGFLYVAAEEGVIAYTIDALTGALTQVSGSPFLGPCLASVWVAVDPMTQFLYSAGFGCVDAFTINATTGGLSPVAGSPFTSGTGENFVSVEPKGQFAYVMNQSDGTVSGYAINQGTGALTPVLGSPFAVGIDPANAVTDGSGKYLYVAGPINGFLGIRAFAINRSTGALTTLSGSPFAPGNDIQYVALDPSGTFIYGSSSTVGGITSFVIDSSTGALIGSKDAPSRQAPVAIVISSGSSSVNYVPQFAYVANSGGNNVSAYTINSSTGGLTSIGGSPFLAGTKPVSVSTDLLGQFAYTTNESSMGISGFGIASSSGVLSGILGSPFGANTPASIAVDPSGRFAYVADLGSNQVSAYTIDPKTGALSMIAGSPYAAGTGPVAAVVDPTGQFLFVANSGSNNLSVFPINPVSGALTPLPFTLSTGNAPVAIAVAPIAGAFQFPRLSSFGFEPIILLYSVNQASETITANGVVNLGALTNSSFATGRSPDAIAIHPFGTFLYVANSGDDTVSAFAIDPASGNLTVLPSSPFLTGVHPSAMSVDPSGKFLYVSNSGDNTVSVFTIDPASGALSPIPAPTFPTGKTPKSVVTTGKTQ